VMRTSLCRRSSSTRASSRSKIPSSPLGAAMKGGGRPTAGIGRAGRGIDGRGPGAGSEPEIGVMRLACFPAPGLISGVQCRVRSLLLTSLSTAPSTILSTRSRTGSAICAKRRRRTAEEARTEISTRPSVGSRRRDRPHCGCRRSRDVGIWHPAVLHHFGSRERSSARSSIARCCGSKRIRPSVHRPERRRA
jgi:hypothetical protein